MAVGSFSDEFTSTIPPKRLWAAAVVNSHILIPKLAPQYIESIELEGDGGVGTIRTIKFGEGAKALHEMVKYRVEVFDTENFVYKYSIVNGADKYESASFETKLEASADGGSVCKVSGEFVTVGDYVPSEMEMTAAKEGTSKMIKGIEAFLIAQPQAYA